MTEPSDYELLTEQREVMTPIIYAQDRFGRPEPPVLWEAMVFPREGDRTEVYCRRYVSRDEAQEGHSLVMKGLADGIWSDKND